MKRKLVQVEMDDSASPPKLYQTTKSRNTATSTGDMNFLDRSPPFGRPNLASTPVTSARNGAHVREPNRLEHHQHQQQTTFDPAAEEELRRIVDNFVNIYEQLDKCGGSDVKPNYSYTELAYLAMLRSPNFCLPINEIYNYIQSRFLFFKNSTRKHWKNAVRHSLAKTMCFTKIPVGRGKSNSENLARSMYLWCILPGSIASFARGDYRPSIDKESGTNTLRWGYFQMNAGQFWDQVGNYIAHKMTLFKKTLEISSARGQIFESQVCTLPRARQLHGNGQLPLHHHHRNANGNQGFLLNQSRVQYRALQDDVQQGSAVPDTVLVSVASPSPAYVQTPCPNVFHGDYNLPLASQQPVPDPWLPNMASPDNSICSNESDRRTSPYLSFDSGNDTYESSPEKSSCRFSSSCAKVKQSHCERLSPLVSSFPINSFDDSGFSQLELSALGDLEFSQSQLQGLDQLKYLPNSFPETVTFTAPVNYAVHATEMVPVSSCYSEAFEENYLPSCSTVQTHIPDHAYLVSNATPYAW